MTDLLNYEFLDEDLRDFDRLASILIERQEKEREEKERKEKEKEKKRKKKIYLKKIKIYQKKKVKNQNLENIWSQLKKKMIQKMISRIMKIK